MEGTRCQYHPGGSPLPFEDVIRNLDSYGLPLKVGALSRLAWSSFVFVSIHVATVSRGFRFHRLVGIASSSLSSISMSGYLYAPVLPSLCAWLPGICICEIEML